MLYLTFFALVTFLITMTKYLTKCLIKELGFVFMLQEKVVLYSGREGMG